MENSVKLFDDLCERTGTDIFGLVKSLGTFLLNPELDLLFFCILIYATQHINKR